MWDTGTRRVAEHPPGCQDHVVEYPGVAWSPWTAHRQPVPAMWRGEMTETSALAWTDEHVAVAGERLQVRRGGSGDPILILHHDVGNPGWLPFHQRLAERFDVIA